MRLLVLAALLSSLSAKVAGYLWEASSTSAGAVSSLQEALKGLDSGSLSNQELKELAQQYGQEAELDPLAFINIMGSMPKEAQMVFLEGIGEKIEEQTGLTCNVYAGKESCVQLSSESEFARLCPDHSLMVDCAFSLVAGEEAELNPVRDIKRALEVAKEQDIEKDCPECFKNLLQWFCASLFPECGSFRASIETMTLPVVGEIFKVNSEGKDIGEALSGVLPTVMKARSLTLPCKEMCLDIMDTCACGERRTLGQLLETYSEGQTGEPLPAAFSMELFDGLKSKPFCDLFSPASAPGFAGTCQTLSRQCSDREGWCQTGNPVPWVAAEIMAGQLAESLSGQMNSQFEQLDYLFKLWTKSREDVPSSADVAAAAEMPAVKSLEEKYLRAGGGAPPASAGTSRKGLLIGIACIPVAVMAGFAGAYWWVVVRKRKNQDAANYIAMTDNDGLLDSLEEP